MSRWLRLVLILAALAVAFMLGYQAKAATKPQVATYDDAAFRPFPTLVLPSPSPLVGLHEYAVPVSGPAPTASPSPSPSPGRPTKQRAAGQAPRYTPTRTIHRPRHQLSGKASWHATGRDGFYAAACRPLRQAIGPGWRGRHVLVAYGRRAVEVRLNDFCASRDKAIDLSDGVFGYFAPLSRGVLRVEIAW